ncbi:MAG: hypothetical protein EAZ37_15490 [Burkholderiales bacterium]|nr:MAG: hypothetical protein EAZ43_02605 [Betaproteobacteria bacterium]TAG24673.1 MAG: hypothetical protein EAZ37_15490 [Burkholderiales bacterium]TAG48179.1 MAG: hypothetical protein EAZ30_07610 [Betaproteobacteria bacterium]
MYFQERVSPFETNENFSAQHATLRLAAIAALTAAFCCSLIGAASAANFVVNSVADNVDASLDGICADASGNCTLRAAMQESVALGGSNSITFNVPTTLLVGNVAEIILTSGPLPLLTGTTLALSINGATQPSTLSAVVGVATRVGTGPDGIVATGDEFLLNPVAQPRVLLVAPAGSVAWPGDAIAGMIRINAVNSVSLNGLQFAATRGPGATFVGNASSGPIAIDIRNGATIPSISTLTVTGSVFGFEGTAASDPGRERRLVAVTAVSDSDRRLNGATVNFRGNYIGHLNYGGILLGGFDGSPGQVLPVVNIEENFLDYGSYGFNATANPIQIWGGANSSISRNLITNSQHESAVHVQRFSGSRIDDNSILNSRRGLNPVFDCGEGLTTQGGIGSFVRQNRIEDSGSSGISVAAYYRLANADGHPVSFRLSKNAIARSGGDNGCITRPTGTLGIDLADSSTTQQVTPNNGVLDPALGNSRMNYPILTRSVYNAGILSVEGYVGSASGQNIFGGSTIEFFVAADDGNNAGAIVVGDGLSVPHGEGYNFIGACSAAANATFSCTLTVPASLRAMVASGRVTATATLCNGGCTTSDSSGMTSEFGVVRQVTDETPAAPVPALSSLLIGFLMLLLSAAAMFVRTRARRG